ncbi:MAG: hypothetical protein JNK45_13835 [Myxococcales bacterium]|nr:hypothetical protein [Myxococcales bacterium]
MRARTRRCASSAPLSIVGAALLCACVLGCGGVGATDDPSTGTATAADTTTTSTTGGTTYDAPTSCASSEECDGGFCVAPYDAAAATAQAGMGEPVCVGACVPELALDRWCLDDAACCGGLQCNPTDGLCVGPSGSSDGTAGESWATLDGTGTGSSESSGSSDGDATGGSSTG